MFRSVSSQQLRAFVGSEYRAQGNPCRVFQLDSQPDSAPPVADITQCVYWLNGEHTISVKCWGPTGQSITLCGHGMLCCATAASAGGLAPQKLEMNGVMARFDRDAKISWLGMPGIETRQEAVPDWAGKIFYAAPKRAASAGGDSGYLVLEWAEDTALETLPVPTNELMRLTKRALIVSCKDNLRGDGSIRFRYFAPQHGVLEDTATGSAMRVLAGYWRHRGCGDRLHALQCSPMGGELYSRIDSDATWIGGRVEIED